MAVGIVAAFVSLLAGWSDASLLMEQVVIYMLALTSFNIAS